MLIEDMFRHVSAYALSDDELAALLASTPRDLDDWRAGMPVPFLKYKRLHSLAVAAEIFAERGVMITRELLEKPIEKGRTFLDYVRNGTPAADVATVLLQRELAAQAA